MDSKPILSFLSRPRTIPEIAERFNIALESAEQFVVEAVESGSLLVSSKPAKVSSPAPIKGESHVMGALSISREARPGRKRGRLPQTRAANRAHNVTFDHNSLFMLREIGPSKVRMLDKLPSPFELFERKDKPSQRARDDSVSARMQLLETLQMSPKSLTEIRALFRFSRNTIERLVRKGILKQAWGPKGVGVSFQLTKKGSRELRQFKAATREDAKLTRKPLISLKTRTALQQLQAV